MPEDYYSFEDVLNELNVDEDELKRMVSEGELRAFRSENKMKFKAEDVDNLKKGRVSEPTVILPSTPTPPSGIPAVDETALELDLESELGALKAAEDKPTEELLPRPPASQEEALVFEDTAGGGQPTEAAIPTKAPDETFAEEEEISIGPDTEPLKFADEPSSVSDEVTVEAPIAQEELVGARKPRAGARRAAAAAVPAYVEEQIEKRRAHWIWSVIMTVTMITTVAYGLVIYDVLRVSTGKVENPSKLTEGTVKYVLRSFWDDPEWVQFHIDKFPLASPDGDVNDPENHISPPFHKYHRYYREMSFREPRKAVPEEELKVIREMIRLQEEGALEEEPPAEGTGG
ncbi:MAG TPA: helix-turn-helix domain-containing protein [Planctomycetota bacterium]|nr:helix-turn-helix domain-containing protein [Planctomycetota bacterium]